MTSTKSIEHRNFFFFAILIVVLISSFVYSQYGFDGYLLRDDALYVYSGQQIAIGIPPYVSVFDHKGPITPMIAGLGVILAKFLQTNDVLTVRVVFFSISVLAVIVLFIYTFQLFNSSYKIAYLTSFFFINFWGFGRHAASGPRGKTPMVLFEILCLWLTSRKVWFLAGFCGSLSFLTWQPTIIFPIMTVVLSIFQSKGPKERSYNLIKSILGVISPLLIVSLYFLSKGAIVEFIDGFLIFNLKYLERPSSVAPLANFKAMFREISRGYTTTFIPIVIGFFALVVIFLWRNSLYQKKPLQLFSKDPYAGLLFSFPLPFIWSLLDFQGYADFFVFLPYTAIGFGWFLYQAIKNLKKIDGITNSIVDASFIFIFGFLIISAIGNYRLTSLWASSASEDLTNQKFWANEIRLKYEDEIRVVSIDIPQALVLLNITNPNPYIYIDVGIDQYINANTSGGFTGWIESIQNYDPDLIFYGNPNGKYIPELNTWIKNNYQLTTVGEWKVYNKRSIGQ